MVFIVKRRSKTSDCLTRINLDLSTPPFYSLKRRKKAGFRTQSHITDNNRRVEVHGEKVVGRAYARQKDWHTAEIEMKKWKVGKRRGGDWVGVSRFFFFFNFKHLIGSWFKMTENSRYFGNFKPFIICPIKKKFWGKKFYWIKKKNFLEKFYRFFFTK
jgi:hypothetical protein